MLFTLLSSEEGKVSEFGFDWRLVIGHPTVR